MWVWIILAAVIAGQLYAIYRLAGANGRLRAAVKALKEGKKISDEVVDVLTRPALGRDALIGRLWRNRPRG